MFKIYYKTKQCYLSLHSDGEKLLKVSFESKIGNDFSCEFLEEAKRELDLYFSKKLKKFSIALDIKGSDFEKSVYKALLEIPYGETRTYKQIAEFIGKDRAYRAVGNANSKNDLAIFVPCHRVVASNGIGGYTGGLDIKRFLLETEGVL